MPGWRTASSRRAGCRYPRLGRLDAFAWTLPPVALGRRARRAGAGTRRAPAARPASGDRGCSAAGRRARGDPSRVACAPPSRKPNLRSWRTSVRSRRLNRRLRCANRASGRASCHHPRRPLRPPRRPSSRWRGPYRPRRQLRWPRSNRRACRTIRAPNPHQSRPAAQAGPSSVKGDPSTCRLWPCHRPPRLLSAHSVRRNSSAG